MLLGRCQVFAIQTASHPTWKWTNRNQELASLPAAALQTALSEDRLPAPVFAVDGVRNQNRRDCLAPLASIAAPNCPDVDHSCQGPAATLSYLIATHETSRAHD